jgi:uncharacterized protein
LKYQNFRYLKFAIENDALASLKMALVSGPRQVGKTTLAESIVTHEENIFTWDDPEFRAEWLKSPKNAVQQRNEGAVLLDEIHKDANWKQNLKGFYDLKGKKFPILVTGSARLDIYRKGGDSLLGRYFPYRLHPFTIGETENAVTPEQFLQFEKKPIFSFADYENYSGFPEPFFKQSLPQTNRWSRLRLERLFTEDVRDILAVQDLKSFAALTSLLPERVGSLLSVNNLRKTLQVAHGTVKNWIGVLESLYVLFLVPPWHEKLSRMVSSEKKFFLYDGSQIKNMGARRENSVALHLLKSCHYWTDTAQGVFELFFLRNKDKLEVDFLIVKDGIPWLTVEVKSGEKNPAKSLQMFSDKLLVKHKFQLVSEKNYDRFYAENGIRVLSAEIWCENMLMKIVFK